MTVDSGEIVEHAPGLLVRQEHANGCGIACIAMVAGVPYGEVHALLGTRYEGRDFNESGIASPDIEWCLGRLGFAWRRAFSIDGPWPPEPFAPLHIASVVQPSGNGHFVVMLTDGTVLDPMSDEPTTLAAWQFVNNVTGFWKVPAPHRPCCSSVAIEGAWCDCRETTDDYEPVPYFGREAR